MCSKCSGNFLRRTGWPLAASRGFERGVGTLGFGHRGFELLEGQGQLPAVHLLGGLAEPRAAQLRQLELQVFDLLIALAKLHIFGLRSGVMLEDEALKSRYVIRQSVDIEHRFIIPAASD